MLKMCQILHFLDAWAPALPGHFKCAKFSTPGPLDAWAPALPGHFKCAKFSTPQTPETLLYLATLTIGGRATKYKTIVNKIIIQHSNASYNQH